MGSSISEIAQSIATSKFFMILIFNRGLEMSQIQNQQLQEEDDDIEESIKEDILE
jgi:hypothetical protein